jgi:rhomboid protease GluP
MIGIISAQTFFIWSYWGPILEEKYESKTFLGILIGTSVINGIFMALFQQPMIFGASTLVYMMIMLVAFVRLKPGEIPVSLALIFVVVLLREMMALVGDTNSSGDGVYATAVNSLFSFNGTSNLAHLIGGISGIIFGFMYISRKSGVPQAVEPA